MYICGYMSLKYYKGYLKVKVIGEGQSHRFDKIPVY